MRDSIEGAVLNLTDVTTLQQTREQLRNANEVLRLAAESSGNYAVVLLDEDGPHHGLERGAERVFGYDSKEIIGQSFEALPTPRSAPRRAGGDVARWRIGAVSSASVPTVARVAGSSRATASSLRCYDDPSRGFVEAIRDLSDVHGKYRRPATNS